MQLILSVISLLLITSVFLSLIKNDFWIFKIFEYPRLQKLFIILLAGGAWVIYWPPDDLLQQIICIGLLLCIIYLVYKIWPYTRFARKEMVRMRSVDPLNEIRIFAANVLQENRNYEMMLQQIKACDPDIICLLETNKEWVEATAVLKQNYPNCLLAPQENTYGLVFYSRLELMNPRIHFLVKEDIPSIETVVILRSGKKIKVWALHPEPPVPKESLYTTAKDKELMKVAMMARQSILPSIVFGDLNDVAWSHTTEMFRKTSQLLDPRRGRGFYSTYNAHNWFIRYPLDYIFCSNDFVLVRMKRLPKNGSDHFATCTHLCLQPGLRQKSPQAGKEEMNEAIKKSEAAV